MKVNNLIIFLFLSKMKFYYLKEIDIKDYSIQPNISASINDGSNSDNNLVIFHNNEISMIFFLFK